MQRLLSIIAALFFTLPEIMAQVPTEELEMQIESVAEGNEENETDLIQLAENLQRLKDEPININFASEEQLAQIPYLNIFQINNLLQYRARTGLLYSPFELIAIKGFDKETIFKIQDFLSFATAEERPNIKLKTVAKYSRHNIILRSRMGLQERYGYTDSATNGYLGSPQDYYFRYKATYRDLLSVGLVLQQDAGEPFGGQNSLIDYVSGHLALTNYGNLKSLVVGDFQAEFGQGLALWTPLAFGKSAEAVHIKRYARGFRAYTGAEENRFLRGAAATYRFGKLDVSAFYSNNSIDANLVNPEDSSLVPAFVSSLQTTGLHRTQNEIADKNANQLQIIGGNLNYKGNQFSVGISGVNYQLKTPLQPSSRLYQKFNFNGNQLSNLSADFNYLYRDLNIYGELAASDNGALAQTFGIQANPADGFFATVAFRNLDPQYQAIFNAPFAESGAYGERGYYLGINWQLNKIMLLKSYVDLYEFKWLRYNANFPSQGQDYLAQLEFLFNRRFTAYARYKREKQQLNATEAIDQLPTEAFQIRQNLRLHFSYSITYNLSLASRVEYAFYEREGTQETGSVLFQDVKYQFTKIPLKLTSRFAIINTPSFNTRIYAYESDLLYAFSIPAYYGRSSRFYLLAKYAFSEKVDFEIRYSISTFYDRDEISSGLNLIEGNKQSEIKAQVRISL